MTMPQQHVDKASSEPRSTAQRQSHQNCSNIHDDRQQSLKCYQVTALCESFSGHVFGAVALHDSTNSLSDAWQASSSRLHAKTNRKKNTYPACLQRSHKYFMVFICNRPVQRDFCARRRVSKLSRACGIFKPKRRST